eukprot:5741010-Pyramimonas_sp.AAC.1
MEHNICPTRFRLRAKHVSLIYRIDPGTRRSRVHVSGYSRRPPAVLSGFAGTPAAGCPTVDALRKTLHST